MGHLTMQVLRDDTILLSRYDRRPPWLKGATVLTEPRLKSTLQPEGSVSVLVFTSMNWSHGSKTDEEVKVPNDLQKVYYKYLVLYRDGRTEWTCDSEVTVEEDDSGNQNNVVELDYKECSVCYEPVNTFGNMCCNVVCLTCARKYVEHTLPAHVPCMVCREHLPLKTVINFVPDYFELRSRYETAREKVEISFASWTDFRHTYLLSRTMQCPRCGVRVEHAGGCNSMICTLCHHKFRWQETSLETAMGCAKILFLLIALIAAITCSVYDRQDTTLPLTVVNDYSEKPLHCAVGELRCATDTLELCLGDSWHKFAFPNGIQCVEGAWVVPTAKV